MTYHKPLISIRRVVVTSGAKHVYDQTFHDGVNIIRGDNGTGKSTIMEFIYFALGGDVKEWTKEALWCDCVFCETYLNDILFTFIRDVEDKEQTKMTIYEGNYDQAIKNKLDWQVFSYRRTENKKSFSQIIFDILGLPYHKTDEFANLTLHQLLRLIYIDQITAPTMIFKEEDSRHDSESTRTAIGEYLFGLDDLESHKLRQELIILNKEFEQISGELRALYRFLGGQNALLNEQNVITELSNIGNSIASKNAEIERIKLKKEQDLASEVSEAVTRLRTTIEEMNAKVAECEDKKSSIILEIMDSNVFVSNLQQKLKSLDEGEVTFSSLGSLSFMYCPACLATVSNGDNKNCPLCKNPSGQQDTKNAYLSMRQEIGFQIAESSHLILKKSETLKELNQSIGSYDAIIAKCKTDYKLLSDNISLYDAISAQLLMEIGALQNSVTNLKDKLKMAKELDLLSDRKQTINSKLNNLKESLARLKEANSRRRDHVAYRLKSLTLDIIKLDDFEEDFENATDFEFDLGKNKTEINGRSRFSASSMVYLKNSFRLAMLLASLEDKLVRLPRFLLMDNIEDKGMQPQRSQTFQHAILDFTAKYEQQFQIIFTTSMIAPDLNDSDLCVGPFYPKGTHTLQFS